MKASAVMVMPMLPLQELPKDELEHVSRFLFRHMRGVDAEHTRRWRRLWARVAEGEMLHFYPAVERSLAYHRMHMAMEDRVFAHQDGFVMTTAGRRAFRNWLKLGASHVTLELQGGELQFLPGSLSYEDMSDDEMRAFHEAAVDYLHTPHALETLWPVVKPQERQQMLDAALRGPGEDETP